VLYKSPEALRNEPINEKRDMWAVGCILHEICSEKVTFNADKTELIRKRILEEQPEPLPETFSFILRSIIWYMLQKNPKNRPSPITILNLP